MHDVFQRFVDRIVARPDVTALDAALTEALEIFDIESYAYLLIAARPATAPYLISNYPAAWTSRYLAKSYQVTDPVIAQVQKTPRSFGWGPGTDLIANSVSHAEFFEEAAHFGICSGFTVPIHDGRSHYAALTFASGSHQPKFGRTVQRYDATLQLMATLFHRAAQRILVPTRIVDGVALSTREYECLDWSAKGKTAWEIGAILGISQRTVVDYLEKSKQKLQVFSITEAVARFVAAASRF